MTKKSIFLGAFLSLFAFLMSKKKGKATATITDKEKGNVLIFAKELESPEEYNRKTNRIVKDVLTVKANNPGAIFHFEKSDGKPVNDWQGLNKGVDSKGEKYSKHGKIAYFNDLGLAVRAHLKTLLSYQKNHGLRTTSDIINRYAPANVHNNHTGNYIKFVSEFLGVSKDLPLWFNDAETLARFAYAQHILEAGFSWVPYSLYLTWAKKLV